MEERRKLKKRLTLTLLIALVLLIGLLFPCTLRSIKAVKASLIQESLLRGPLTNIHSNTIYGNVLHGGGGSTNTPTNSPAATNTATVPPSPTATATNTATVPPSPTATAEVTQTPTVVPTATEVPTTPAPSLPPTVGPGGSPGDYSTAGIIFGLIGIAALLLYYSGTIIAKRHQG